MKRIPLILVAAFGIAGCDSEAETESATDRTLELADSIDALLGTLGGHMTDVLAADGELEIRALETLQWERSNASLRRINYWLGHLDECVDETGEAPHTAALYARRDEAELVAIGHILSAILADDLTESAREAEIDYQLLMTNQMATLRANPIYNPEVSERYTCPVLPEVFPDFDAPTGEALAPGGDCTEDVRACMPALHDVAPR